MKDILIGLSGDMTADAAGDITAGDNANYWIGFIVLSAPGHWKQFPLVGVNILSFLNASISPVQIQGIIIEQLKADIFPNPNVDISAYPVIKVNKVQFNVNDNGTT